MESYLMITQINDFIFCPRSIFFSGIYRGSVTDDLYHQTPQRTGQVYHEAVDEGRYSTRKAVITGMTVYSGKYRLLGRIDIFDTSSGVLTERKYRITAIHPGFRYQLYAQYFALEESGFKVKALRLHSSKDNKIYPIALPGPGEVKEFEDVLAAVNGFSLETPFEPQKNKCSHCIYAPLCDADADVTE